MTSITNDVAPPSRPLLPGSTAEALVYIVTALMLLGVTVGGMILSTPLGVGICLAMSLALFIARPASAPLVLVTVFMFQNLVIASFTPLVPTAEVFDTLRGSNFVILVAAYAAFIAASFQVRLRSIPELRPWLLGSFAVLAVVVVYLGIGVVAGEPRDAIVYFRNTITPLACFHIALVTASLYRVDLTRGLLWLGAAAMVYGYGELFFTVDFLALFNGDQYIERQMVTQIETGYWERVLQDTGFVLRGLHDVMTTPFFNTGLLEGILPSVWRLAGPNFHPISYAYALSIVATLLIFRGRWVLPLLIVPVLLVIGSKGAMALLLVAIFARVAIRVVPWGLAKASVLMIAAAWVSLAIAIGASSGDYHVLGLFASIRDFLGNPLGVGLGLGGNISSAAADIDWQAAQANGATEVPVESAVGVMLYQMGIGTFVFFGFLAALVRLNWRLFRKTGNQIFLFAFVTIVMIMANAVLQEEAFYSPLALGFCLIIVGLSLGTHWRERRDGGRQSSA